MKKPKTEGVPPLQFPIRKDYLAATFLSAFTLVIYAFTAAPGVTLADSADFINGVLTLGIVHPPGYPLYTVLGHLFSFLPLGDLAFRVNLFSALWGSLCLGTLFLILRILSIERILAAFATLFLGFTTVFWSKTGTAEVYSFNGFLIASIVFCILRYNRDKKKSQLYLLFLMTGLALANHYPLVILTGLGLVFLLDRRDLHPADLLKALPFLGLGLTPYLYLFIQASRPDLQYNFGKLSDFGMVLDHILRRYYANDYGGALTDKFVLAYTLLKATITNFFLASPVLFLGLFVTFRQKWPYRYSFLIAALSPSLGLILILTFPSDDYIRELLLDYLIPTFLFFSLFLAIGLRTLATQYAPHRLVQVSFLVILLLSQAGFNFRTSSHHNDTLAQLWGTDLLNSLEPDSILILCGQGYLPIYHLQLIQGLRQDVTIYDRFSFYTKDNLYAPALLFMRDDPREYRNTREQQLLRESTRPIYYTCKDVPQEQNIDFSFTPFVFRAVKPHREASHYTPLLVTDNLLASAVRTYPKSEYWRDRTTKGIFSRTLSYYGRHDPAEANRILTYLKNTKLYSDSEFMLSLANNMYYFQNYELARQFYERGEELSLDAFTPTDLAVFCHILTNATDYKKALAICTRQERSSPPCEVNTVKTRQTIAGIYTQQENWHKVAEYSRKILKCQPTHETAQTYLELASQNVK